MEELTSFAQTHAEFEWQESNIFVDEGTVAWTAHRLRIRTTVNLPQCRMPNEFSRGVHVSELRQQTMADRSLLPIAQDLPQPVRKFMYQQLFLHSGRSWKNS